MATSFFLWPSAQHKTDDGGGGVVETNATPAEAPAAKAKGRKGGAGAKAGAPKRPPQRGLGVAQLEQLRIQERWKKITELDPAASDIPPLHFHQLTPVAAAAASAVYGAPVAYSAGYPLECYLHRCRPIVQGAVAFGGTAAAGSAVRSVPGKHCALDRYRTAGDARFRVGSPLPEPPSSQITQCLSDQCEFCTRKKRLFGNNLSPSLTNGADYFEMDLAAAMAIDLDCGCHQTKGKSSGSEKEREAIKEFEFFPPSSLGASNCGGSSELADRRAGESSSSSSAAESSTSLDLSLKLSL